MCVCVCVCACVCVCVRVCVCVCVFVCMVLQPHVYQKMHAAVAVREALALVRWERVVEAFADFLACRHRESWRCYIRQMRQLPPWARCRHAERAMVEDGIAQRRGGDGTWRRTGKGATCLQEVNPPGVCDRVRRPVLLRWLGGPRRDLVLDSAAIAM